MGQFFEMLMVVCFGVSWPFAVVKSYRVRTTKGKSLLFISLVWIGYVFGIAGKIVTNNITYVFIFYVINLVMVSCDIAIYFRNKKLEGVHRAVSICAAEI